MVSSVILSTVGNKYSGITSGISTATGQLGASVSVAIFGAFLAEPRRIADGTRIAASFSAAANALTILIIRHLRRQRERV